MTMKAGRYYVGDLGHVMKDGDDWSRMNSILFSKNSAGAEGEFSLDGRWFAIYNTSGDGVFNGFSVDSGSIGCIRVEDISEDSDRGEVLAQYAVKKDLGKIVEFEEDFETSKSDDGTIKIGHIQIDGNSPDDVLGLKKGESMEETTARVMGLKKEATGDSENGGYVPVVNDIVRVKMFKGYQIARISRVRENVKMVNVVFKDGRMFSYKYDKLSPATEEEKQSYKNGAPAKPENKTEEENKDQGFKLGDIVYNPFGPKIRTAIFKGEDPDSKDHYLISVGKSLISAPKSDVYKDKELAKKASEPKKENESANEEQPTSMFYKFVDIVKTIMEKNTDKSEDQIKEIYNAVCTALGYHTIAPFEKVFAIAVKEYNSNHDTKFSVKKAEPKSEAGAVSSELDKNDVMVTLYVITPADYEGAVDQETLVSGFESFIDEALDNVRGISLVSGSAKSVTRNNVEQSVSGFVSFKVSGMKILRNLSGTLYNHGIYTQDDGD